MAPLIDVMALKCKEKETFNNQLLFDTEDRFDVQNAKKTFVELEDSSEDEIDISKFKTTFQFKAPIDPLAPKPILHSYTENTGDIVSVKRKKMSELIADSKTKISNDTKRVKTD